MQSSHSIDFSVMLRKISVFRIGKTHVLQLLNILRTDYIIKINKLK